MPQVSVIVPVYKVEPYLHRCVDSILSQTFSDFELILVDDGSPDNCLAICEEYAASDKRVRVVHKENGGLSSARNAGLRIAQGRYIMFCDSDDYVSPRWCECMYRQAERTPNAFVYSDLIRSDDAEPVLLSGGEAGEAAETDYYTCYAKGLSGYVCNKIYSAERVRKQGLFFDETAHLFEDVDFNLKYLRDCSACVFVTDKLYVYIQRDGSIMHKYDPDWLRMHLAPFYDRIPYIGEEHLAAYCDGWLYTFLTFFPITFDKRNPASWWEKLAYNQRMLASREFQFCLHHATGKNENPLVLRVLKTKNYPLLLLLEKAVSLKNKLKSNRQEERK